MQSKLAQFANFHFFTKSKMTAVPPFLLGRLIYFYQTWSLVGRTHPQILGEIQKAVSAIPRTKVFEPRSCKDDTNFAGF